MLVCVCVCVCGQYTVSIQRGQRGQNAACHVATGPAIELGHVMTRRQPMAVELAKVMPNNAELASYNSAQVRMNE